VVRVVLAEAAGPRVSPKVAAASDGQYPLDSRRQCVVVAVVAVAAAAAVAVVDYPSVACAISPRAATWPADSKTRPELVNEKTDEDTGQSLGYG